jgi:myo-inositol-1(or 4)-monophosphatase
MAPVVAKSLEKELRVATDLARRAGAVALAHCGTVERLTKTHATTCDEAVTVADRAVQREIIAGLRDAFADDGIIGEENESGSGITAEGLAAGGRNWVIDPIDGTNNFIAGLGNWAVCIGLLDAGMPVLGVVYDPTRDLLYAGAPGGGATVNGRPCRVKDSAMSPASILMLTSNLLDEQGRCPAWAVRWLRQTQWKIRILGSAALEATLVGAGVAHGAITVNGKLWDCAAAAAFVLAAGGLVTGLDGGPIFPFDVTAYRGRRVPFLAASPAAHADLLADLSLRD